jgi:hypothetical protein
MAIPWGLLTVVVGFAYGALKAGKQDKGRLFRDGLIIGVVLALVLAVIGALTGIPLLAVAGAVGAVGILITAILLSLLFILGVWLGDLVTGAKRPG